MKKVIYLTPNCDYEISEFKKLSDQEKLHVANNTNEMFIYTLEGFQDAFNNEYISDLGFIFIVTD